MRLEHLRLLLIECLLLRDGSELMVKLLMGVNLRCLGLERCLGVMVGLRSGRAGERLWRTLMVHGHHGSLWHEWDRRVHVVLWVEDWLGL